MRSVVRGLSKSPQELRCCLQTLPFLPALYSPCPSGKLLRQVQQHLEKLPVVILSAFGKPGL